MALIPPSSPSCISRLATIHTNVVGHRVFQLHNLNLATKSLEPEDPEKASAFLPNSGITLGDPDSQLMVPVLTTSVEGVIIVGQDSACFIHTGRPSQSSLLSPGQIPFRAEPSSTIPEMAIDEASPANTTKGKGKAEKEPPSPSQLSLSSEGLLQMSTSPTTTGSAGRRSSASLASSPPGGTKRKLSEGAKSSGRGKATIRRDTKPIECNLPVSHYSV